MSAAKKGGGQLKIERPTTARSKKLAQLEDEEARLVVNLPQRIHTAIKMRAVERRLSLKAYILELVAKDGIS